MDKKAWWQPAIVVFVQLSAWIGGPIIIALFLGSWLDQRYQTGQRYFFICLAIAFVVSNVGLAINVLKYSKKIEKESRREKLKKKDESSTTNTN